MFHGYGKLTLPDGTYYEGNWIDGMKHGSGKLARPSKQSKASYSEMVEQSMQKPEIEIIEGDFVNGSLNGEGKIYYPDGSMYKGALKDNKKNGYGRY